MRPNESSRSAGPANGDTVLAVRGLRIVNLGRISAVQPDGKNWKVVVDGAEVSGLRWIADADRVSIWAVANEKGTEMKDLPKTVG